MHTNSIENGMVIGAAAAYEKASAGALPLAIERATQELLADVEEFSNALAWSCTGRNNVSGEWFARFPERLAEADDATLLQIVLAAEDENDAPTVMRALGLLKRRFLERNDTWLQDRAAQITNDLQHDPLL